MIFCVEDDRSIRELVTYTLQNTGYACRGFEDGKGLYQALREEKPELVLLDVMLPDEDGLSILKTLRAAPETAGIPVILVTAKSSEYDRVIGLDSGADDYVVKPFGMMELLARIRAVKRRTGNTPEEQPALSCGIVSVDEKAHKVYSDGDEVPLTLKEFDLLCALLRSPGTVLTRDMLLEKIWGYDAVCETRTVDVHIRTLRQKLGAGGDIIETVRGVGYRAGTSQ